MKKNCVICGNEFKARGRSKTCGESCSKMLKRNRDKTNKGISLKPKICIICQKEFESYKSKNTCGEKCQNKRRLILKRARFHKWLKIPGNKEKQYLWNTINRPGKKYFCSSKYFHHAHVNEWRKLKNKQIKRERARLYQKKRWLADKNNRIKHSNLVKEIKRAKVFFKKMVLTSAIQQSTTQKHEYNTENH